ncbi:MAG: glycosyltransferase family 2 protein [Gemmataceae bacterium]
MPDSPPDNPAPLVSIIMPTYNRARFLPQALESIRAQTLGDWELVVVDDGSTDDSGTLLAELSAPVRQPVRYVYQENQGAYGARNTGLEQARGKYVAFFDSDDVWLPHHLKDCVEALEANSEVDWVYGAGRRVDLATGRVVSQHSFYVDGRPRPFLNLRCRTSGQLRIIEDPDVTCCMIRHGLYSGLQNSVIRRDVFSQYRFDCRYRNEAEDQLFVVRALKAGHRLGYFDKVHVVYNVHAANSSGAALGASPEKLLFIFRALVRGYEDLRKELRFTPAENRALNRRLSQEYFWNVGYTLLWRQGKHDEALTALRRGLRLWPWEWRYWKTYLTVAVRSALGSTVCASTP